MPTRSKRKSKSIEILAKLTQTGIAIPSVWNKNRLLLEAQRVPPAGADIKLTINFISRSKSGEMLGFYWGGVLPLWIAHMKDLITAKQLEEDPLAIKKLISQRFITKNEINQAHDDFMLNFRPVKAKNWLTGREEVKRDSLADMDGYNAALYISEVYQHVLENTGLILNTKEFKKAKDSVDLIIHEGPKAVDRAIEYPKEKADPGAIPF